MKAEAAAKREEIELREQNRNNPVDDSGTVDDLFGFLPPETAIEGEGTHLLLHAL